MANDLCATAVGGFPRKGKSTGIFPRKFMGKIAVSSLRNDLWIIVQVYSRMIIRPLIHRKKHGKNPKGLERGLHDAGS